MGTSVLGQRRRWLVRVVFQMLILVANSEIFHRKTLVQEDSIRADHLPSPGVQLIEDDNHVVMSNGIVSIRLTVPGGAVTNITYKGCNNVLLPEDRESDRGHWDIVWNKTAHSDQTDNFEGTIYKVIVQNENQTEISFTRTWTVDSAKAPLNVDKRFVMLRDSPGFYTYAVLERQQGWPAFYIQEARVVFKLNEDMFEYMAVSDVRQRFMPKNVDRRNGQRLDYKEAVLITNATNPAFDGEVDDKYLYSCDNKDIKVHGWAGTNPSLGFWMITPTNEFRTGGPLKQDLTTHLGPTVLNMFTSTHYAGEGLAIKFGTEEHWKKVLGPIYIYLNSNDSANADPSVLWIDAKERMLKEEASWPYDFPLSEDFVKSNQRGSLSGQLLVRDWFVNKRAVPGASAYVGLAPPGEAGSWQRENKGYQFWTRSDENGSFSIKNVIPGNYSLFAWVPGFVGDYKHASDITVTPGSNIHATNVVFVPPRNGPTLWEIGIPDRSALEFFIPNPDKRFKIHEYREPVEKFRQYGLWARYEELYPKKDLVFTIGSSNYSEDWFFSQVMRRNVGGEFVGTTWQILFDLKNVEKEGNYTLQLALASTHYADLQVRFNDRNSPPQFKTGQIGMDNALARHGIRGIYHYYSIPVHGSRLLVGRNTLFLTQASNLTHFKEIMYDYIRLEGPTILH